MVAGAPVWEVRLTIKAKADFRSIIDWTDGRFGRSQAKTYSATITTALRMLKAGPGTLGAKARDELGDGVFVLPVERTGRRRRHLIVFRVDPSRDVKALQVLRILHDAMDLPRHVALDDDAKH